MILSIFLGAMVGVISALTGLGGGVILVPLLPLALGFNQKEAVATSLFVVFLNGLQLAWKSYRRRSVDLNYIVPISVFGLLSSYASSLMLYQFSNYSLQVFMTIVLGFIFLLLIRPPRFTIKSGHNVFKALVGTFAGMVSGLTGLGGGIIVGPLLLATRSIPHRKLSPAVSFVTMVFAGSATITHMAVNVPTAKAWGPIQWQAGLLIFVPAFIVSSKTLFLHDKLSENQRRQLLLIFCTLLFLKSVLSIL